MPRPGDLAALREVGAVVGNAGQRMPQEDLALGFAMLGEARRTRDQSASVAPIGERISPFTRGGSAATAPQGEGGRTGG